MPVSFAQTGRILFGRYQGNQNTIASGVSSSIAGLWASMIDPENFTQSWKVLEPILRGIIDVNYSMSAADAAQYYGLSRSVAGFYGTVVPGAYLNPDYLAVLTNNTGLQKFLDFQDSGRDAATSSRMAMRYLIGNSIRVVLNGGRNTITNAVASDDVALGWERAVEPRTCSYCAMLAASSLLHKTASDAFHAHDNCQCLARVVFRGQSPTNGDLASEWSRTTEGKSGKDAVAAWNQYWSGRSGNGNSVGGTEAQAETTGQGTGNAAVSNQSVQLA